MITINLDTLNQKKISANSGHHVYPYGDSHVVKIHQAASPESLSDKLREIVLGFNHDHPRIVANKGLFVQQEEKSWSIFTVMPKMPKDFAQVIDQRRKIDNPFNKDRIIEYMYTLVDVHEYLQLKGITNGNLKPSNIFFNENEEIFVSDIGLKHHEVTGTLRTIDDVPFGDPHYLAPEILDAPDKVNISQEVLAQGDVWSLGVIILELCLLERVKVGEKFHDKRIEEMIARCKERYGPKISTLLENMLRFDPKNRWSFQDCKVYIEKTIFNVVKPGFNIYINPINCMNQIGIVDILKNENKKLEEKAIDLKRRLTLKKKVSLNGEMLAEYEERDLREIKEEGEDVDTTPQGGVHNYDFRRDMKSANTWVGVSSVISTQTIKFEVSTPIATRTDLNKNALEVLTKEYTCEWDDKTNNLKVLLKDKDRGDRFIEWIENMKFMSEQLNGLDIRFHPLFLDSKAFTEIAELIPSFLNLKSFSLDLRDAREQISFNTLATMFPDYSKLTQLSIVFSSVINNEQAISLFKAIDNLKVLKELSITLTKPPTLTNEAYTRLATCLKRHHGLKKLHLGGFSIATQAAGKDMLEGLGSLTTLHHLSLNMANVTEHSVFLVEAIARMISLNKFEWRGNRIPKGLEQGLRNTKHLYWLYLYFEEGLSDVINLLKSIKGLIELRLETPILSQHEVKNEEIKLLGKTFKNFPLLYNLSLKLGKSDFIEAVGFKKLLKRLKEIKSLELQIYGRIKDKGMQKLREGLSKLKTLTNLWIEFPEPGEKEDPVEISQTEFYKFIDCFKGLTKLKSISLLNLIQGLIGVKGGLGCFKNFFATHGTITKLELDFKRCYFVSVENIELIAMEISNLAFLEHLTLSFDECRPDQMEYETFRVLISNIETLKRLKVLNLSFHKCYQLIDEFPTVAKIPTSIGGLEFLRFNFKDCKKLTSKEGLNSLAESIARNNNIKEVSINLKGCDAVTVSDAVDFQEALENIPTIRKVLVYK